MASTSLSKSGQAGNQKKMTCSVWFKPSGASGSENNLLYWKTDGSNFFKIKVPQGDDKMDINNQAGSSNLAGIAAMTFGDINAWYHLVVKIDTSQAVEADRFRAYVNGDEITEWTSRTYPSQDTDLLFNKTSSTNYIGSDGSGDYFDGYMAQFVWVDGTAYAPTTFGSTDATTGEWKPKSDGEIRSAVTFGTNGFLLNFSNASYLGYDYQTSDRSGTTNDYTVSGSGYKTLDNPSDNQPTLNRQVFKVGMSYSFSNANQGLSFSNADWALIPGTIGPGDSGKWYFEAKQTSLTSYAHMGFLTSANLNAGGFEGYFGQEGGNEPAYGYGQDGKIYYSTTSANGQSTSADWDTFTSGDIIMCALDLDNNFIYFGKNGTWGNSGDPTSGSTGTGGFAIANPSGSLWLPAVAGYQCTWQTNFGAGYFDAAAVASGNSDDGGLGTFEYDVPAGYRTICTKNIKTYG